MTEALKTISMTVLDWNDRFAESQSMRMQTAWNKLDLRSTLRKACVSEEIYRSSAKTGPDRGKITPIDFFAEHVFRFILGLEVIALSPFIITSLARGAVNKVSNKK